MTYLKILNKIPKKVAVAVSGGLDSMVALEFLLKSKRDILVLHFNHSTKNSDSYEDFVVDYCNSKGIRFKVKRINSTPGSNRSMEDFWREERYKFFLSEREGRKVILCHHLDDVIETWVFSSLNGQSKLIPYERDYVLRPFLLNKKTTLNLWAISNNTTYIEDKTNLDNKFIRNYIRNKMMEDILYINPGIHKNLKKKIIKKWRV